MGQIDWVQIPAENSLTSLEALIHFVYGPKLNVADGTFGLIISPTNRAVNLANSVALAMLDGEEECFEAVDTLAPGMDKFLPPEEDLTKIAAKTLKVCIWILTEYIKFYIAEKGRHCYAFEKFVHRFGFGQWNPAYL